MKRALIALENSFCLFSILLITNNCSPSPEKPLPKEEEYASVQKVEPVHATHSVEIVGMKFQPEELKVKKGDSIVFINKDILAHDVTEELGNAWTSGPMAAGSKWGMVAEKTSNYYCSIHVVMKGKILVVE